jgi:hypothetical protein
VRGGELLAQFLVNINRIYGQDTQVQIEEINAEPALIIWQNARVASVFTFSMDEGIISTIRVVVNPDKLRRLTDQLR